MYAVCPAHITVIWFRLPFSKTRIRNIRTSPLYVHQRLYPRITKDLQQGWPNVTVLHACQKFQNFFAGASGYMIVHISWKMNNRIQSIHTIHFYLVKQWRSKRCLTLITEWSDRTAQNIKISYNFQPQIVNARDGTVFYLQFFESHLRNSTVQFLKFNKANVWETRSSFVSTMLIIG